MNLVTVLILVAVPALVALLALAPNVPVRSNGFPGRRRATHRRTTAPRSAQLPPQRGIQHHAR